MQVVIAAVGKLKETYWREALAEYAKRLSGYVQFEVVEVADEPTPDHASETTKSRILHIEAQRLSKHLRDRDGLICLDIHGQALDSIAWSHRYQQLVGAGHGRLVFLIGGSLGLHPDLLAKAHFRWSLGPITMPHQLARVVLVEQLYRGIRIERGEPYHK